MLSRLAVVVRPPCELLILVPFAFLERLIQSMSHRLRPAVRSRGFSPAWQRKKKLRWKGKSWKRFQTRCSASSWTTTTRCSDTSPARCGGTTFVFSPATESRSSCRPMTSVAGESPTATSSKRLPASGWCDQSRAGPGRLQPPADQPEPLFQARLSTS